MSLVIDEAVLKSAGKSIDSSEVVIRERVVDSFGRSYATGKRKNAVAKVWIKSGSGAVTINGKPAKDYLNRDILLTVLSEPLVATENLGKIDVVAKTLGGGKSGQAGAIRHGIGKALVLFDPDCHRILRSEGYLTRDSRVVESKKYGLKKARKAQTYRKR